MDFELDEAQRAVQQGVRKVAGAFDLDYWRDVDKCHRFPEEFWRALADGGITSPSTCSASRSPTAAERLEDERMIRRWASAMGDGG